MNIEDELRALGTDDHDNPLAGRGPRLVAAARRRRRNRQAGVTGVAAAAVIAVGLLVPGIGRDDPVDPGTSSPADPVTPVVPVPVCDLTIEDLDAGSRGDVEASLSVTGSEAVIALTNTAEEIRTIRELGNEVWLVDAGTGHVVAYQADLTVPIGVPVRPGEGALAVEALALTPCDGVPPIEGDYVLFARGSVLEADAWLAGPVGAQPEEAWFREEPTEPTTGALRPDLCEESGANLRPSPTPPSSPNVDSINASPPGVHLVDGHTFAGVMLANTGDTPRTAWAGSAEFLLVDRWTLETVGYAASTAEPEPVVVEPRVPTVLEQSFQPRSCDGEPLADGWYLLYARGEVSDSDPWLAEPTLIGWVDGEPGAPPSDAAEVPTQPDLAVPFDAYAYPWQPPRTSAELDLDGWLLDVPLSGAWDGADTIQEILTLSNGTDEQLTATVYAWVILVEPDGEEPISIAVEPQWELPLEIDLAPGEETYVSAVHWLGRSTGDHRLPDDPLTLPGEYEAYVVLVDAPSYDHTTGTGFAYAVGGPFPLVVD